MNTRADAVSLRDIVKTYRRGKEKIEVLHHLDLSVPSGEFLALMGPSGSGKTTVLNLIGGLDHPDSGEVVVAGEALTMYSAVSARAIEIATLRAIGFGAGAVVASVITEALLLAGAAIGAAIAWIAFNGNQHMFGSLVFTLAVTPALIGLGAAFACVLGFIGGLLPALRAARRPVAMALRAT